MAGSRRSLALLSAVRCQFAVNLLLLAFSAIQCSLAHGSTSLGNLNLESVRSMNSAASKALSFSKPSVDTVSSRPHHGDVINVGSLDGFSGDRSSAIVSPAAGEAHEQLVPQLSERQTSKLEHRVRTKRTWKNNRVQAAWGKRSNSQRPADATLWRRVKISDARLRRKWSQVGRQAWGKRDQLPSLLDEHVSEPELSKNDYDHDDVLARNRRKWGVGSAKAAWGKRSWGELEDGSANDKERSEVTSGRSKRSITDATIINPLMIDERWVSSHVPIDSQEMRLRRPILGTQGQGHDGLAYGRLLVRSMDQRPEYYVSFPADSAPVDYEDDQDSSDTDAADLRYVWNEVDDGTISKKTASDKEMSLRVWSK